MFQINCTIAGKTIPGKVFDSMEEANNAVVEMRRIAKLNNFPAEYTVANLKESLSMYRDIMEKFFKLSSGPLIIEDFDQVKYAKAIEYLRILGNMKVMIFSPDRFTMILIRQEEKA